MTIERDKIEQEFLEQAQKSIKKLLDELPQTGRISLSDMERVTGRMGQDRVHFKLVQNVVFGGRTHGCAPTNHAVLVGAGPCPRPPATI